MSETSGTPTPRAATDGGREVLFEETLSMRDVAGAGNLISKTRLLFSGLIVITVAAVAYMGMTMVSTAAGAVGGTDELLTVVRGMVAGHPLVAVGLLAIVVIAVAWFVLSILGIGWQLRKTFDTEIHIRVTSRGLAVERAGSRLGQSSGVEVPFETITALELPDWDDSATGITLADANAVKFLAGRSQSWIRVERADGAALYLGSDSPRELAETIAHNAPPFRAPRPLVTCQDPPLLRCGGRCPDWRIPVTLFQPVPRVRHRGRAGRFESAGAPAGAVSEQHVGMSGRCYAALAVTSRWGVILRQTHSFAAPERSRVRDRRRPHGSSRPTRPVSGRRSGRGRPPRRPRAG